MKYFKLQKAFKLYDVLYEVLWMHIFMDLFKVSSSPDKKEETTKEEEEKKKKNQIITTTTMATSNIAFESTWEKKELRDTIRDQRQQYIGKVYD